MDDSTDLRVTRALAALAVADIPAAAEWTTRLLGRPADSRPMDSLAEWSFGDHGTLQLVLDPERAGGSRVTLQVHDIAAARRGLAARGIAFSYDDTTSTIVKFGQIVDPDGNAITLVEPIG
jgi:catechol 2,3-dioxygenase-like lactoylglutathione lyase family enzyme